MTDTVVSETSNSAVTQGWLTVRTTGSGPDVILLPGLSSSSAVWSNMINALSDKYTLHLVDVAGFAGHLSGEERTDIVQGLAADVAGYMEERNLNDVHIVGHSMGGFTALHVARDQGEKIAAVTIVDSLPFYSLIFDPNATVESVAPRAAAMTEQMRSMPKTAYDQMQDQGSARLSKTPEAQLRIAEAARASDRDVVLDAMEELMTTDIRSDLPMITPSVTIIYAHDDRMGLPVTAMDELYASAYSGLPDVSLIRIDGSFHFIMDDQPELFEDALSSSLQTSLAR